MSTRAAISSIAAVHATSAKSETNRNAWLECVAPPMVDQFTPAFTQMIRSMMYEMAIKSPAMNTNGATRAITSLTRALADSVDASPLVDCELPAKSPAMTVPIQPPPAVTTFQGWVCAAQRTRSGPYTALSAMIIQAVA